VQRTQPVMRVFSWDGATLALSLILGRTVVIGRAVAECVLLSGLWSALW